LGNNRVVFTAENGIAVAKQVNNYDPFGMRFSNAPTLQIGGAGDNNYLYNDKEYHNDFELGWLEYGTRFYDPTLGRFGNMDLLAEIYHNQSPFAYAANNPVNFIDFMGMGPNEKNPTWRDNSGLGPIWGGYNAFNSGVMQGSGGDYPGYPGYPGGGWNGNYDGGNYGGGYGGNYSGFNFGGLAYGLLNSTFSSMQHLDNSPQPMASVGNLSINMQATNASYSNNSGQVSPTTFSNYKLSPYVKPKAQAKSLSAGFAFFGGYILEIGSVNDEFGSSKWFFTFGPTIGFFAGVSYNEHDIIGKKKPFVVADYPGLYSGYDIGLWVWGLHNGGNLDEKWDTPQSGFNPIDMGDTYQERGCGVGKSVGKIGIYWSKVRTITW
jgi:RHS repeat-associated protein